MNYRCFLQKEMFENISIFSLFFSSGKKEDPKWITHSSSPTFAPLVSYTNQHPPIYHRSCLRLGCDLRRRVSPGASPALDHSSSIIIFPFTLLIPPGSVNALSSLAWSGGRWHGQMGVTKVRWALPRSGGCCQGQMGVAKVRWALVWSCGR